MNNMGIKTVKESNMLRNDLMFLVENNYDIGTVKDITPIHGGCINKTYKVQSDGGIFAFRQYSPRRELKDIEYEHAILKHLASSVIYHLISNPINIRNTNSQQTGCRSILIIHNIFGESYYSLFPFISSVSWKWTLSNPNWNIIHQVGSLMALLHISMKYIPYICPRKQLFEQIEQFRNHFLGYPGNNKYLNNYKYRTFINRFLLKLNFIDDTCESLTIKLKAFREYKDIVHGDIRAANILVNENSTIVGLLDFDFYGTFISAYDIANSIKEFGTEQPQGSINRKVSKCLIESYNYTSRKYYNNKYPDNDIGDIIVSCIRLSNLRCLDWLLTDTYYPLRRKQEIFDWIIDVETYLRSNSVGAKLIKYYNGLSGREAQK